MALVGGQVDSHQWLRGHTTESALPTDWVWEAGWGGDWRVTWEEMACSRAGAAADGRKVMTHDNLENLR